MRWRRYQCTYGEPPPSARCGHCVAKVNSSVRDGTLVVFHGGTNDRQVLSDLVVLASTILNLIWIPPVLAVLILDASRAVLRRFPCRRRWRSKRE